ncbi:MAG: T9SS type A sorting domain-containing protein [Bacteroidetes bacterium]|nr:T9SS type A sorting domain-containing protein [Bacteroidota bacterium]
MKKSTILTLMVVVFTTLQISAQYAPVSTIGTVNSNVASTVVPIRATNFINVASAGLRILYNPAIISVTGVSVGSPAMGPFISWNGDVPGEIMLGWYAGQGVTLPDNSVVFNLTFSKVGNGASTISFDDDGSSCEWSDGNFEPLIDIPTSTYYINGSLTLGNAPVTKAPVMAACPGTTISIPVSVTNFDNIGSLALKMLYNSSVLTYQSCTNNSGFPGLTVNGATPGTITIPLTSSTSTSGVSLAANSALFTLNFTYNGGSTDLTWSDNGPSCLYKGPSPAYPTLVDTPTSTFYLNGAVHQLIAPTIIRNPDVAAVCMNAPVSATFSAGSGGIDPVDHYESSIDAGSSWQIYIPGNPLTATTPGPAQIKIRTWRTSSGDACVNSGYVSTNWDVLPQSEGGTLAGNATVCTGTNSVTLTLTGYTGTILKWQFTTNGNDWFDIAHTDPVLTATNLTISTAYRAVVQQGICEPANSSVATIIVNPILPVSITIAADANPSCEGNQVSFTAFPVNGGIAPSFQWKVNGLEVSGATNATYSYIPLNADYLSCTLTSSEICVSGNPALSNILLMVVNPVIPVSVTIAADANPVCEGSAISLTAYPVNGGASPQFQWKLNAVDIPGATNSTYSYIPVNNDTVSCLLTTSETVCVTGNPATSNKVGITVNPLLPVSVIIAADFSQVCAGTHVNFTATAFNGGTSPGFQWKVNAVDVPGATNSTFSFIPANNDTVTCLLTVFETACRTGNPAISNKVGITVNPLLPVSITIAASANPVCEGTSVIFTSSSVNGGLTPLYQWKINELYISGATDDSYSYIPANGDYLTCNLASSEICVSGNPATSNTVTMAVNPFLPASITIAADFNPVCTGMTVSFTATAVNGGNSPAFQWKLNSVDMPGATNSTWSYIPTNNDVVTCVLTSNETCVSGNPAISNPIIITVNPLLPVSVVMSANFNPVCEGTIVNFIAIPVNGGASPAYQWRVNSADYPGATNSTFSITPANNDVVTCVVTSNESCVIGNPATSNPVVMTVNPLLPVSVTIVADANPVCAGVNVHFTATPVNGGLAPVFQWEVNAVIVPGATNSTWSYIPQNNDAVKCIMTSNVPCSIGNPATSMPVVMTVNPLLPVSVAITPDANPVCAGTTVHFTATPVHGGASPGFHWLVNSVTVPGATNATFSYVPANNDVVTCVLTSNETCVSGNPATSNPILMTVNPLLPVSVAIAANANPVCAGTTVSFTAIPVHGGSSPGFHWTVNTVIVPGATTATFSYIPANNDVVICVLTSNETCVSGNPATSNPILITVNPLLPVSVTIAANANPVCAGTTVYFTATPVHGGNSPGFQWKINTTDVPGATSSTYFYIPTNNDVVTCVLTSNEACVSGNPAVSNSVTMMVNPLLPVSVTIAANANPVCAGTVVHFTATPFHGGISPGFQWTVNAAIVPGATSASYSYIPSNNDAVACTLHSNETCVSGNPATSNILTMTVHPLLPVSITIAANANPVCSGTTVHYTASPVNGGISPIFQWKVNNIDVQGATNFSWSFIPVQNDAVSCMVTSSEACVTGNPAASNIIIMAVMPLPVPIISGTGSVCVGTSNLFYTTEPGMTGYNWTISSGGTITFNAGAAIIVTWHTAGNQWLRVNYTNGNGCSGAMATQFDVTVHALPVPTISGPATVCAGAPGNVYTTEPGMTNYLWSVSPGGTITSGGGSTSATMTITWNSSGSQWVRANYTNNGCSATSPSALDITVNTPVAASVTIVASANPVNSGTAVTFTASPVNGGALPTFQWKVNGSVVTGAVNSTYTYIPVNNDAVICAMTSDLSCVSGSPANSNMVVMVVNGIPDNTTVQNETVGNLQTKCYNALQTITVAGTPTTFVVETGGNATFIAGNKINYLPGSTVHLGGYMLGKIAPTGPFCGGVTGSPAVAVVSGVEAPLFQVEQPFFTLYPNPTSGNFTLVQKGNNSYGNVQIEVFDMRGERMLKAEMVGEKKHEFSMTDVPAGLYFVKIVAENYTETIKIVKTK